MRSISTLLLLLATSAVLSVALPAPEELKVNEDANERADDGAKAVENELKIQESLALEDAGCFGGVIEGAACEKIDADFKAKIDDALGVDDDEAEAEADKGKEEAKADKGKEKAEGGKSSNVG